MANLQLFAKWGLIILIIVSLGVLIERLTETRRFWGYDYAEKEEINATMIPIADIIDSSFAEEFSKCLTRHSLSHYYIIKQISSVCRPHKKCLHNFLIDLIKLLETLDIKLMLLEPSLLFCLLPSSRKYNLITRGFNSNEVQRSRNVVTFGVHVSDVKILDQASSRNKIISAGYRILKFQNWSNSSTSYRDESENYINSAHYFIIQKDMMMHLIVLMHKGTYLWSPGFNTSEINFKGLQYVNDRAFENFSLSLVHLDTSSASQVFLPLDARCFLLDFMSSNFIECEVSPTNMIPSQHTEIVMALKELKKVLASQMVSFWLWSKTLQGWFEKCDILHYTEELKFSVAARSVYGFNFTGLFINGECQHTDSNYNMDSSIKNIKLNCYGIPVDLIFMYNDKDTYWYEYADGQNVYRLTFPKFSLCSTDIVGQKIAVPCETSEIFESEYGQFLKNTSFIFDTENMKNVLLMDKT